MLFYRRRIYPPRCGTYLHISSNFFATAPAAFAGRTYGVRSRHGDRTVSRHRLNGGSCGGMRLADRTFRQVVYLQYM